MTDRQELYFDYLMDRLGFDEPAKHKEYFDAFIEENGHTQMVRELKDGWYSWKQEFTLNFCFSRLQKEVDIRKNPFSIKPLPINRDAYISATDIANYNYCPASYSISKSMEIKFPTNSLKTATGTNLHEDLRLVPKDSSVKVRENEDYFVDNRIAKIKGCELVFAGHSNNNRLFYNQEKNFVGQPDYIFKDPNGQYFVVEEKFKTINKDKRPDKNLFFNNNLVQLQSYIKYIKDYKISYGILIYWFYEYDYSDETPYVKTFSMRVIHSKDDMPLLNKTHSSLLEFLDKKETKFNFPSNVKKCVACVVNKYCAHKTDTLKTVVLPYSRQDLKLKKVDFPAELLIKRTAENDQGFPYPEEPPHFEDF